MYRRKPDWLKIKIESGKDISYIEKLLSEYHLNSVCKAAKCPNRVECYGNRTATFIILGTTCTRNCKFCNIKNGYPKPPNIEEPENIAKAVKALELKYIVITSVTRDDLKDGGASHFIKVVEEIRVLKPDADIELLIPDLGGNRDPLDKIIASSPTVINHNMESVERLYSTVRKGASYKRSLDIISRVKETSSIITKSGVILGMGETEGELKVLLNDLFKAGCDLLTLGQYCQPTKNHLEVSEYITPEKFDYWKKYALDIGFKGVASGPLVRSSYNAKELICSI